MLPEVKPIPKVNQWVPINRNYLADEESGIESSDSDQDSDCSQNSLVEIKSDDKVNNCFMTDTLFVELIDALFAYQVKDSSCDTRG